MTFLDLSDGTGAVEFPYSSGIVFRALESAVLALPKMSIVETNRLAAHLSVKTSISAFSWGERLSISVLDAGSERSRLLIQSGAKTIFGSASAHGKNRKNVEPIISATSLELAQHADTWTQETRTPKLPVTVSRDVIEARLQRLADLRNKGLVTEEESKQRRLGILEAL